MKKSTQCFLPTQTHNSDSKDRYTQTDTHTHSLHLPYPTHWKTHTHIQTDTHRQKCTYAQTHTHTQMCLPLLHSSFHPSLSLSLFLSHCCVCASIDCLSLFLALSPLSSTFFPPSLPLSLSLSVRLPLC